MESKYSVKLEELNENTSHRIILSRITPGSMVLECGCASGYMTRYMKEKLGANVSIIELNPSNYDQAREYAVDGICTDLEDKKWCSFFQGRTFDFILFADVLEHLRNPEDVLKRTVDLLKEDGTIIASIPNVAHADIMVNLLNGRWNYTPLGLLDNTHIHFWAEKNLDGLFRQAGLTIVEKDYTILPPFMTEQKSDDKIDNLLPAIQALCHQPYADVYQFVYCAKKTAYARKRGIACTDHYTDRHLAYWAEPPCCSEYQEEQNRLAAQHAEQEKFIQVQRAQISQLELQSASLSDSLEQQQVRIAQLEVQNTSLSDSLEQQQVRIAQLEEQNRCLSESYNIISNAFFWRITKPARAMLDHAKPFLRQIKKILLPVCYNIEEFSVSGNKLRIRGWIFDRKDEIEKLELMLRWNESEEIREITKRRLRRTDVEAAYQTKMGLQSGFDQFFRIKLPPTETMVAFLLYTVNGQRKKVRGINLAQREFAALLEQSGCVRDQFLNGEYRCTPLPEHVDIIVPVYNGYSFLEKLYDGLRETDSGHRIIFIDDNSPDKRILPALRRFASERENVTVLHNEQNLGFVKTVNRGLKTSTQHVVILNTDVELPRGWIERLMEPVFQFENVASVTPFSNCATIFSFPVFGDNMLYRNLSVDELDRYFQSINPQYTLVPTGVGFCMGLSRKALDAVGLLDDKLFEKGYGEENDWCQRAIKAGFVNVHAENLFVYHKHGGSFLPEEKKRLIEEHTARLTARHPNYPADVAKYIQNDPLKNLRAHLRFCIRSENSGKNNILVFTHDLGGGADMYLDAQCPIWQKQGKNIFLLRYSAASDCYRLNCMFSEEAFELELADWEDLVYLLRDCAIGQIIVNELVTYPELFSRLSDICAMKQAKGSCLTMLIHDYLAVSPSFNLVSPQDWVYAREGNGFHCDRFYEQDGWAKQYNCPSIASWRQLWERFLLECDEVRCFSEDSRQIILSIYPTLRNLTVVPHVVDYMPRIQKACKTTATLNIGVLGTLTPNKGKALVRGMWELIEREDRNIKIVLIGYEDAVNQIPVGKHFEKTGRYRTKEVPDLVLGKDIDLFLMPSIWPETFSYATEEIMQMGFPIVCLNVGAPAERVKSYEKGLVLLSNEPERVLSEICAFAERLEIMPTKETERSKSCS